MEFYPNDITLVAEKTHFIKLYVDSEIVPLNSKIEIEPGELKIDSTVEFSNKCLVNDTIGCINVIVSGGEIDESYEVKAKYE